MFCPNLPKKTYFTMLYDFDTVRSPAGTQTFPEVPGYLCRNRFEFMCVCMYVLTCCLATQITHAVVDPDRETSRWFPGTPPMKVTCIYEALKGCIRPLMALQGRLRAL